MALVRSGLEGVLVELVAPEGWVVVDVRCQVSEDAILDKERRTGSIEHGHIGHDFSDMAEHHLGHIVARHVLDHELDVWVLSLEILVDLFDELVEIVAFAGPRPGRDSEDDFVGLLGCATWPAEHGEQEDGKLHRSTERHGVSFA